MCGTSFRRVAVLESSAQRAVRASLSKVGLGAGSPGNTCGARCQRQSASRFLVYPVAKLSHEGLRVRRKPGQGLPSGFRPYLNPAFQMFGHCCLEHWVKKDSEVISSSAGKSVVIS